MKYALITGATSGIGKAITDALLNEGIHVYGIGRDFNKQSFPPGNFTPLLLDLTRTDALEKTISELAQKHDFDYLVNVAGQGVFRPHEELSLQEISDIIDVNLKAPVLLSNLLLSGLKRQNGYIFNITSIEALRHSKFSALYTATKSGLRDFGLCLFEEVRKSGVKVTSLNPDMTKTPFFQDKAFDVGNESDTYLHTDSIAQTIISLIHMPQEHVVTDLTIRPQRFGITKKGNIR